MIDQPEFSKSSGARAIVRIFAATKPGDFVSYAKLSNAIARNVQTEARHVLEAARRALQREHNIVLGVVRNQGLRHLADDEAIESGHSSAEHIRRTAKQAAKRIVSLKNPEGVSRGKRSEQFFLLCKFGLHAHIENAKNSQRLEAAVNREMATLPVAKTLELFRGTGE